MIKYFTLSHKFKEKEWINYPRLSQPKRIVYGSERVFLPFGISLFRALIHKNVINIDLIDEVDCMYMKELGKKPVIIDTIRVSENIVESYGLLDIFVRGISKMHLRK